MSDKGEKPQLDSTKTEHTKTVDLEMKLMEVGPQKYHIDMRQNGKSRFISISEGSMTLPRRSRVVVPMSAGPDFCEKVYEVLKFSSTYVPKNVSERKSPRERIVYAFSTALTTPGGRKYYLDVIDADLVLTLRMSYVFGERRDSIHMLVEALPNFLEIVEDFKKNYPSIHPSDDYPATNRRRGGFRRGAGGYGRQQRPFNSRGFGRQRYRSPRGAAQYNGKASASKEAVDGKRISSLKVLTDPTPANISHNAKRFTFEMVEGANTFMRITEIINDLRKSTLHVPVEVLGQMQTCIGDMSKKYSAVAQRPATTPSSKQ